MCRIRHAAALLSLQAAVATQLFGRRPSSQQIHEFCDTIAPRAYNHEFVGAVAHVDDTATAAPLRGLRRIEYAATLGKGRACYRRARRQLLAWRMHEGGNSAIYTQGRIGDPLATVAAMPHPMAACCWVLNPCRVTVRESGPFSSAVGYATLDLHLIAGEERMSVTFDASSGTVRFRATARVARLQNPQAAGCSGVMAACGWSRVACASFHACMRTCASVHPAQVPRRHDAITLPPVPCFLQKASSQSPGELAW